MCKCLLRQPTYTVLVVYVLDLCQSKPLLLVQLLLLHKEADNLKFTGLRVLLRFSYHCRIARTQFTRTHILCKHELKYTRIMYTYTKLDRLRDHYSMLICACHCVRYNVHVHAYYQCSCGVQKRWCVCVPLWVFWSWRTAEAFHCSSWYRTARNCLPGSTLKKTLCAHTYNEHRTCTIVVKLILGV